MRRNAIMKGFWIFQVSEHSRFLHKQAFRKVLNMLAYGWIMSYGRVLNMPGLRIWQGCEYARVTQDAKYAWKPEYALTSKYPLMCLNNAEYDWICRHTPDKTECWICQNYSECVLCSAYHKFTLQFTEQLPRQMYWEHFQLSKMLRFAKRIMPQCRCVTINFSE